MSSLRWILVLVAVTVAGPTLAASDDGTLTSSHLHLKNQDFFHGELVDGDQPNSLRWRSPLSDQPLDFPVARINALYCRGGQPSQQQASHCLELVDGDIFYGDVLDLTPEKITLKTTLFDEVSVPLDRVLRLMRCQEGRAMIYSGPSGLVNWKVSPESDPWQVDGGQLAVEGVADIEQTFPLPPRFCLEVSLVAAKNASLLLAVGDLFSVETFGDDLTLVRETAEAADIASLQKVRQGDSRLAFHIFVDIPQGKVAVCNVAGKLLGSVQVPSSGEVGEAPLIVKNFAGRLRCEQLVIRIWNGILPNDSPRDGVLVHLQKGDAHSANELHFNAETQQLELTSSDDATRAFPWNDVAVITFPAAAKVATSSLRLNLRNGDRVSGDVRAVRDRALQLQVDKIGAPLSVPIDQIDSLVGLSEDPMPGLDTAVPLLDAEGVRSHGELVDTPAGGDPNRLYWRPRGSSNVAELYPDLSARIRFRTATLGDLQATRGIRPVAGGLTATDQFRRAFGFYPSNSRNVSSETSGEALTLQTGDSFVCRLKSIDETHVTFASDLVDVQRIRRSLIQSWHTSAATKLNELHDDKRDRLLTLPRRQRDDPPTHMIESVNGDFLRGRLINMNEESITLEVRLEERKIDRNLVRRIVWLVEEKLDDQSTEGETPEGSSQSPLVQAVYQDGFRLTFMPEGVAEGVIQGRCVSLGACHVKLSDVNQLLLGNRIGQAAAELADVWKLKDAQDPLFAQESESPSGGGSSLVGAPAPDFTLDLLDGEEKFTLSQQLGRVVVLDFWATWCGPCIQAMPQIDGVVQEFDEADVILIGVNMQEDRQAIRALLERIKVSPTVVLDIDGATAEKYQVTAIPQTVVIDREGKVANLFVGGGPQLAAQLRDAIKKGLGSPEETPASEAKPDPAPQSSAPQ
ncbi:redoxin domain-containing protein [Blastopirellula sp. JC732]|uniref:Redoxin domain-containing protein n=1 Tax=Blastopirellula sediminis TaxID=2894196 RepID=A0A9X1MIX2_9BACT|nr:TlpA disulfide reductase family protein [Blastopirellula sediminis]MCC9608070.1 redoxin domain-containing protein [Blastopirellula sediminis]MCC9627137.1 redoxin domain-containing protein [Blastopirellula sediminis]